MDEKPSDINLFPKEPYPNFYTTLHQLMLGEIEYTKLRILIIKIVLWVVMINIVLSLIACILSVVLPLFGISILTWLLSQIKLPAQLFGPN